MYVVFGILVFSFLVITHELGHFLTAKLFDVKVNEFSIFMGPRLLKWGKGETEYSLRLFPFGGYCAMEGEDGENSDPRAFVQKAAWKRIIILCAGAFMNALTGLIIVIILCSMSSGFRTLEITNFMDGCLLEGEDKLQIGDEILKINDEKLYIFSDFSLIMSLEGEGEMDLTVRRDGQTVVLHDLNMVRQTYETENGEQKLFGLMFEGVRPKTVDSVLRESFLEVWDFTRMVWLSLKGLISGQFGLNDMSGPVGVVSTFQESGSAASSVFEGLLNVLYIGAFLAVNLAVVNLLPIPAVDGGRIFTTVIVAVAEKLFRRKIDPKYESYIHAAGFVLLMGLIVLVTLNDIKKLLGF